MSNDRESLKPAAKYAGVEYKINIREMLLASGVAEWEIGTEEFQTSAQRRHFEHYTRIIEKIAAVKLKGLREPVKYHSGVVTNMVNRFLGWKLPSDFSPDCGIEFHRIGKPGDPNYGRFAYEPVGTNLFTADQAKTMFEYCLNGVAHQKREWVDLNGKEIAEAPTNFIQLVAYVSRILREKNE